MTKKVTGKYSIKAYQCEKCDREFETGTNHWGKIYACPSCGVAVCKCLEPRPKGYGVPEEWKIMKLGDVCEIIPGVKIK